MMVFVFVDDKCTYTNHDVVMIVIINVAIVMQW